jgi:hypothetical protein
MTTIERDDLMKAARQLEISQNVRRVLAEAENPLLVQALTNLQLAEGLLIEAANT